MIPGAAFFRLRNLFMRQNEAFQNEPVDKVSLRTGLLLPNFFPFLFVCRCAAITTRNGRKPLTTIMLFRRCQVTLKRWHWWNWCWHWGLGIYQWWLWCWWWLRYWQQAIVMCALFETSNDWNVGCEDWFINHQCLPNSHSHVCHSWQLSSRARRWIFISWRRNSDKCLPGPSTTWFKCELFSMSSTTYFLHHIS